ncbi:hypothetical protein M8C21_027191, partial [Ambrosia artemisiifolia]
SSFRKIFLTSQLYFKQIRLVFKLLLIWSRSNDALFYLIADFHTVNSDLTTFTATVDMVLVNNSIRVKIYILPGVYREKVMIPPSKPYVSFIGDPNCASEYKLNTVVGLLLCQEGSKAIRQCFIACEYRVHNTLLDETGSHYFYRCYIQGSVDFIFGNARSLYKDETIKGQNGKVVHMDGKKRQLVQEEKRERGKVGSLAYWKYLTTAYGGALTPVVLLAHIMFESSQI